MDVMTVIRGLIEHTAACSTDPHRGDDTHDLAAVDLREIVIYDDAFWDLYEPESDVAEQLMAAVKVLRDDPARRDELSRLALDLSLCPIHFHDYAICFDDDTEECAAVRAAFPSYDT